MSTKLHGQNYMDTINDYPISNPWLLIWSWFPACCYISLHFAEKDLLVCGKNAWSEVGVFFKYRIVKSKVPPHQQWKTPCRKGAHSIYKEQVNVLYFQQKKILMLQHSKTFQIIVCFQLCGKSL